jgi:hypothetical protein
MKKIIFLVIILLQSCNYNEISYYFPWKYHVNSKVKYFINDIYENPEKLRDIKNNYPEFYDSTIIYKHFKDTVYINKVIKFINNKFQKIVATKKYITVDMEGQLSNYGYPKGFDIPMEKRYDVSLEKDKIYLEFFFVKEDDGTYKIFDLGVGPGLVDYYIDEK